jgi:hypothetical protein
VTRVAEALELIEQAVGQTSPPPGVSITWTPFSVAGYFVIRDGQTLVTPRGLEWLRSILPYLDAGSDPSHPERPS